jgi:ABC-type amino acid transport substrate-binding protein
MKTISRRLVSIVRPLAVLVATWVTLAAPALAQEAPEARETGTGDVWIVGTKVAPPFAYQDDDGDWQGIGIELWHRVAESLGISYELRETTLDGLISGVESGTLDASVAAITVTPGRERRIDFTQAFYSSGLGIAVPAGGGFSWRGVLALLVQPKFLQVVAVLALVLFIAGTLVWLFERSSNHDQFPDGWRGLVESFWWSAVTMTTVGYGDKAPNSTGGRLVALVWMFASIVIISSFTGALASSLTVSNLSGRVRSVDDLAAAQVVAVQGATSETWLDENRIRHRSVDDLVEALDLLAAGDADAVVHDKPILQHLTAEQQVQVLGDTFDPQGYAIALPTGSPWRERIDVALLEVLFDPRWADVVESYLGDGG